MPENSSGGTVKRSVIRRLDNGRRRDFPAFDDLAEIPIAAGEVASIEQLLDDRHDLISDLFFDWVYSGQTSCLFAANLAQKNRDAGWISAVVTIGDGLHDTIGPFLDRAADEAEAANLIFPGIDTPERVVELINLLCSDPRWYWEKIEWSDAAAAEHLLVGLRWMLPSNRNPNWVLGFAPIDTMPFTRRIVGAPFSTLALRVRDAPDARSPDKGVHLCDMPDLLETPVEKEAYWTSTGVNRRRLLGTEFECAAKAKVTFSLPMTFLNELVPPRNG